jgi:hypothetical protein
MTQETDNGSSASTEGVAGSEQQQETQQQNAEVKPAAEVKAEVKPAVKPAPKEVPPMPTTAPPEGCEFIFDEKSGIWRVRNIAADISRAIERREGKEPGEPDPEAMAETEVTVNFPEILPDAMRTEDLADHVIEVAQVLSGAGYSQPQIQRLVDLGGEIALDVQEQPHYEDKEAVDAHLRKRWGSEYDTNLKATRAAAQKLGSKFLDWLDQGHGNNLVVIELLSALGRGDFSVGKAAAEKQMAALRASAPFKDKFHRDHQYTVNRYRIFANAAARGEDNGAGFEAAVSKALGDQIKRGVINEKGAPAAAAKSAVSGGEAKIAQIRSKLATVKNGSAEWRELRVALNNAYAEAYPGTQE